MTYMYTDGRYHSINRSNASTMMQAFNYGTAAFEGMKALYNPNRRKLFLFRPDLHLTRLKKSAAMIGIDFTMTSDQFIGIVSTLVRKNRYSVDIYVRPLVYRNEKGIGLTRPSGYGFSVFAQMLPRASAGGLRCCFVSQRRPGDGSCSVKLTGNYVLSFLSSREAASRGFDTGILLSTDGFVSETSVMNIFFVDSGRLCTPSLECDPLDGITRRTIIELARKELPLDVREGKYRPSRLLDANEVFLCGTGSGVRHVRQIEDTTFEAGRKDQLAPILRNLYREVCRGRVARYSDWLVPLN